MRMTANTEMRLRRDQITSTAHSALAIWLHWDLGLDYKTWLDYEWVDSDLVSLRPQ